MRIAQKTLSVVLAIILIISLSWIAPESSHATEYEDGTYYVYVELSGGSGRVSVSSTGTLIVSGGYMTVDVSFIKTKNGEPADIVWVKRNGTECANLGNATFRIPVDSLYSSFSIVGMTDAMSQPYEIDYTLYVDGDGVTEKTVSEPDPEPTGGGSSGGTETPAPSGGGGGSSSSTSSGGSTASTSSSTSSTSGSANQQTPAVTATNPTTPETKTEEVKEETKEEAKPDNTQGKKTSGGGTNNLGAGKNSSQNKTKTTGENDSPKNYVPIVVGGVVIAGAAGVLTYLFKFKKIK